MYADYLNYYTTYTAKFGPKVAIFLMVGMFYEMYDERNAEGLVKTSVQEVVDLLGLAVSVKKGEGPSGPTYDGIVAGVPEQHIHKWSARLTQLGWTVVLVGQVKNAAGKVIKRQVERILTPGSHIESAESSHGMYLTFVSIKAKSDSAPNLSLAAVDLTTGTLNVFETQANGSEDAWTSNDVVQFMELYPPREVLWSIEGPKYLMQSIAESKLRSIIACNSATAFHKRDPINSGAWLKPKFREDYLRSRCSLKCLLPTHAALHLAPDSGSETALLSLLYALEELWPSMNLGSLVVHPWIPGHSMRLGENALVQLHMIEANQKQDVLGLFDSCATSMGHRGLRERLLKPSADPTSIRACLDAVEAWTVKPIEYRALIHKNLRTVSDLERIYRKLQQGTITAADLINLDISFRALKFIANSEVNPIIALISSLNKDIFAVFDATKIYEASDDISVFTPGTVPALDDLEAQIKSQMGRIDSWIAERAKSANVSTDSFKIEFRERSLVVKASKTLVQSLKNTNKLPPTTSATINKTNSYLESTELDQIYTTVTRLQECLKRLQSAALMEQGTTLATKIFDDWLQISTWITSLDVNLTLAHVSLERGYVKPEIHDAGEEGSSVHVEGLRHPLLEAQDNKVAYVQHTVSLGLPGSQGWLLYGLNASGKSSLMRATGLAVILAQAGCFVPATKMVLRPFQSIHTRIINTDNLWMGLSSFAVEMSEMRDIFRDAGNRSLVLGDELCSGTETTSATALVAAGIKGLLGRGARFLFASHLHGLSQIPEVSANRDLKIWHLHVEYDKLVDKLIYHRSLKSGSGSALYGLEVAKAMRIPSDILEDAIHFRKRLTGESELSESIGSFWNKGVIRRKCQHCGASELEGLEVHHIRERSTANATGHLPDGSSVHSAANLIVLCDACHDEIHRANLVIKPAIQTSDGPEDSVVQTEESPASQVSPASQESPASQVSQAPLSEFKSKWSEEELTTIETVCRKYPKIKDTKLSEYLLTHHEIQISGATIKKIREKMFPERR
jgi:DNA mismatch repair protein MutS